MRSSCGIGAATWLPAGLLCLVIGGGIAFAPVAFADDPADVVAAISQDRNKLGPSQSLRKVVQAPDEFEVTLFASPDRIGLPIAVSATATGVVYLAIDEAAAGDSGKILRCVDTNDDGTADLVTVFAKVDCPRGLVCQGGSAWVLHPPYLSLFHDDDGDGTSDRSEVLVTGLGSEPLEPGGVDHAARGMRMGIGGWIYIAVGDRGLREATGTDGSRISLQNGGIIRVRPDGRELEVFADGLRNPTDVGIDPYLNMFACDQDARVRHLLSVGSGNPMLDPVSAVPESLPENAGGGATLYCEGQMWPERFRGTLLTCNCASGAIDRRRLASSGVTFDVARDSFVKIPHPVALDMDGSGRLYVCSWFDVNNPGRGGFVTRIAPYSLADRSVPRIHDADVLDLIGHLTKGESSQIRMQAQHELLRRGKELETSVLLIQATANRELPLAGRVAAIFTLKQLDGEMSHPVLFRLLGDDNVREFALRALTDRKSQLGRLDPGIVEWHLSDRSPRVRGQAIIGLSRLRSTRSAWRLLPMTWRSPFAPPATLASDRMIAQVAVQALVSMNAVDECVAALDGPFRNGAMRALSRMRDPRCVDRLIESLDSTQSAVRRRDLLSVLVRIYGRDARHELGKPVDSAARPTSDRIAGILVESAANDDDVTVAYLRRELIRQQIFIPGIFDLSAGDLD